MRSRAVFDTNILFSAVGWGGKPAQCVQLARDGEIDGLTCGEILDELAEKLESKLGFSDEQITQVLGSLLHFLAPILISGRITGASPDPKDDMVLECAAIGKATHVVSGDKKHLLQLKQFQGIPIISAAEFLSWHGANRGS